MHSPLFVHGPDRMTCIDACRAAARALDLPFEALDATWGEDLPAAEESLVARLAADPPVGVVALGTLAVRRRMTRIELLEQGVVVALGVPPDDGGDLLRDEAHARVDVVADLLPTLRALRERRPICVPAGERSYLVDVAPGALDLLPRAVADATVVVLVTDTNVRPLHGDRVIDILHGAGHRVHEIVLPAGETNKNARSLVTIWKEALAAEADRDAHFVAVGGGVVTDVAGLAAATWMRGVPWVAVPTTLLGMVDASVGGKTAIDLMSAKNAVGAFWQPAAVLCDVGLSGTEPLRGHISALAEVVKSALIGDVDLLHLLESRAHDAVARDPAVTSELVRRSVLVKAHVVSRDERESGLRAVLNLGHTIGHALEAQAGYEDLSHGEAISLGLIAALRIGVALGHTPEAFCLRVEDLLHRLKLPTRLDRALLRKAASLIAHDKKRRGDRVKFVFARGPGQVSLESVPLRELEQLAVQIGD